MAAVHEIEIRATAQSFLHNQIRSFAGTLKLAGEGKMTPSDVRAALDARDHAGRRTELAVARRNAHLRLRAQMRELDDSARKTIPMDLHVIPPASPPVSVDIDIDELQTVSAFEALLPEVDVPVEPTAGRSALPGEGQSLDFDLGFDDAPEGGSEPGRSGRQGDKT